MAGLAGEDVYQVKKRAFSDQDAGTVSKTSVAVMVQSDILILYARLLTFCGDHRPEIDVCRGNK